MIKKVSGKVTSIFPDHINTDDIIAGWALQESTDRAFFGQHAFAGFDSDFVKRSSTHHSNVIVAGENFGSGSSREQAIYALQENNITAVLAKSFPDIFYRNALNNGLILIKLSETEVFDMGHEIEIDLHEKIIIHPSRHYKFEMDTIDANIFALGGKTQLVRDHLEDMISDAYSSDYKHFTEYRKELKSDNKHRPQTMAEKIISLHANKKMYAGDRLDDVPIDLIFINDAFGPAVIDEYHKNFGTVYAGRDLSPSIFDKDKVFFIADHDSPPSTISSSNGIAKMREFSSEQGCKFYKPGDGIEHVVLLEDGYIVPGSIVLGTDSHTCTNGAFNCLAFGVGTTDATYTLATGKIHDFIVPETIRVNLCGKFGKGVYAKDLILYMLGLIGVQGAVRQVLEFGGPALRNITIDGRTTIANMAVEMAARSAIFEYDDVVKEYMDKFAQFPYQSVTADEGCKYTKVIDIDISELEPCVAFPHKPDNVTTISKIDQYMAETQNSDRADTPPIDTLNINNGFLGACTNGKYEDMVEAAKILKGKKVHEDVDFVVIPASRKIYNKLLKEGILEVFAEAGANIESSTCGPCYGKHKGLMKDGGQMISSSNRNFVGRMGSKSARIFLASPATVIASVISGKISDPRNLL